MTGFILKELNGILINHINKRLIILNWLDTYL